MVPKNVISSIIGRLHGWVMLIVLATLTILRSPYILKNGRFWAEEFSVYFKYAFNHNWFETLLFVYSRGGYYYLSANLNAIFATMVPLKYAPLVTVYGSLMVLFLLFGMILFIPSLFWEKLWQKSLGCFIFLLCPSFVPEVWLNSINTQVYWGLIAFVILFIDQNKNTCGKIYLTWVVLLISALSGLYACILLPFFFLKSLITRIKADWISAFLLLGATFCQLSIVVFTKISGQLAVDKLSGIPHLSLISDILRYDLLLPVIGNNGAQSIVALIGPSFFSYFLACTLILGVAVLHVFCEKNFLGLISLLCYLVVVAFTAVGCHGGLAGRYIVMPGALMVTTISGIGFRSRSRFLRYVMLVIVTVSIGVGVIQFRHSDSEWLNCINCPDWTYEVEAYAKNPVHRFTVWPYPWWQFYLTSGVVVKNIRTLDSGHLGEFVANRTVVQPITLPGNVASQKALRIEILMATFNRHNTGSIEVSLVQGKIERMMTINIKDIRDSAYHIFRFDGGPYSPGPAWLVFRGVDGTVGNAVTMYLTRDTLFGNVIIDDQEKKESLVFRISQK